MDSLFNVSYLTFKFNIIVIIDYFLQNGPFDVLNEVLKGLALYILGFKVTFVNIIVNSTYYNIIIIQWAQKKCLQYEI